MKRNIYTPEQLDFLRTGYATLSIRGLTPKFNARFGMNKTERQIKSVLNNHRITCGRKHSTRIHCARLYTLEQVRFLTESYQGRSVAELTALFNGQFATDRTKQQIKTFVHNRGVTSGRTGRFEKGSQSWNKGIKGYMGANATSFEKGNIPKNRKPIGTERICSKDGFVLIKVAETNPYTGAPTRYKHKHVHVWEKLHDSVPKGHVVSFIDGDKLNCAPENLMLLTRKELLCLNLHNYKDTPAELKPSVLALAKLEAKAGIRSMPGRGRRKGKNDRLNPAGKVPVFRPDQSRYQAGRIPPENRILAQED